MPEELYYMEKPWGYHGEWSASGGPAAKNPRGLRPLVWFSSLSKKMIKSNNLVQNHCNSAHPGPLPLLSATVVTIGATCLHCTVHLHCVHPVWLQLTRHSAYPLHRGGCTVHSDPVISSRHQRQTLWWDLHKMVCIAVANLIASNYLAISLVS